MHHSQCFHPAQTLGGFATEGADEALHPDYIFQPVSTARHQVITPLMSEQTKRALPAESGLRGHRLTWGPQHDSAALMETSRQKCTLQGQLELGTTAWGSCQVATWSGYETGDDSLSEVLGQ